MICDCESDNYAKATLTIVPSFTVPVITSVILALVSTLRWQTQSEDEELNMIPFLACNNLKCRSGVVWLPYAITCMSAIVRFPKLNGTRNW